MIKKRKIVLYWLVLMILSACGFHLRGQLVLPAGLQHITIYNLSHDSLLEQRVKTQLKANGISLNKSNQATQLILQITSSHFSRSLANLSSNTQWRQYTLRYQATFQFNNHKGKAISKAISVSSIRHTAENPNQLLGSKNETRTLQQEMRQELAIKILDHLNAPAMKQALQAEITT